MQKPPPYFGYILRRIKTSLFCKGFLNSTFFIQKQYLHTRSVVPSKHGFDMKALWIFSQISLLMGLAACSENARKAETSQTRTDCTASPKVEIALTHPDSLVPPVENTRQPALANIPVPQSGVASTIEVVPQQFKINPEKDTILKGRQGTRLRIAAGTLEEAPGSPAKGPVVINLAEYYRPSDMILAGLATHCGKKILETSGMVHLTATAGGKELTIKKGEGIDIVFGQYSPKEGNEIFVGTRQHGRIDWQLPAKAEADEESDKPDMDYGMLPHFNGSLDKYLDENLFYPPSLKGNLPVGRVVASFEISPGGAISGLEINGSIHPEIDRVIFYTLLNMPPWIPAMEGGKPIRSFYQLPVAMGRRRVAKTRKQKTSARMLEAAAASTTVLYDKIGGGNRFASVNLGIVRSSNTPELDGVVYTLEAFGWINCDRFFNFSQPLVTLRVNQQGMENFTFLFLFKRMRGIIAGHTQGGVSQFTNVPLVEKGMVIAYKIEGKAARYVAQEIVTSATPVSLPVPSPPIAISELGKRLEAVNAYWN